MSFVRKVVSFLVCVFAVIVVAVFWLSFTDDGFASDIADDCEIIVTDYKDGSEKAETSDDASFFELFEEQSVSEPSGIEFAVVFERGSGDSSVVDAVYRDTATGVMYVWIGSGYSGTGLSVMLNADGLPILYHEKTEEYDFSQRFQQVYDDVFIDVETKVMYLRADGAGHSGISVMFGSDGKPLTYEDGITTYDSFSEGMGR